MHRLIKPLIWTILFLVMMLVIDQLLVQVPPVHPAHAAVSNFYRDFRSRMIDLVFNEKKAAPQSIEAVIEKEQSKQDPKLQKSKPSDHGQTLPGNSTQMNKSQRYVYSDSKGELQFADSLDEVPVKYRAQAQPMAK